MNKLMTRIYTATVCHEDAVIDQLSNDIDQTRQGMPVDSDEYSTSLRKDGSVVIHDKVNNQYTKVTNMGNELLLSDISNSIGKFNIG